MAGMEVKVETMALEEAKPQPLLSFRFAAVAFSSMMLTWSFGWLYLGETWDPLSKTPNIQVGIMNCDNGIPGSVEAGLPPSFTQNPIYQSTFSQPVADSLLAASVWNESSPASYVFYWKNVTCSANISSGPGCGEFTEECYQEAIAHIENGDYWHVWFIPDNFSENMLSWYLPTRGVYQQLNVADTYNIYTRGRSFTTLSYTLRVFLAVFNGINQAVFQQLALASRALGPEISKQLFDPMIYSQPFTLLAIDLAPVKHFGQHMASYIFCLLIWLGSTFCVAVFNMYKTPAEIRKLTGGSVTKLDLYLNMGMKAFFAIVYTFILNVLMHCILFALGKGEEQWMGHNAGYSIAFGWWLSFCNLSMNAMLLYMLGPSKFSAVSAFMLVLQLTSGGAIFSDELSNPFFQIGHGLPFYYGVRGFRTIFFGTMQNVMWANWLIIFGWNVLSFVIGMVFIVFKLVHMDPLPQGAAAPVVIAVAA